MSDADTIRMEALLRDEKEATAVGPTSSVDPSGYYACLSVSHKATPQEIRRAFLFLSQRYHTDKHSTQGPEMQTMMNERFSELQAAYTVLSDERQRAAYDAGGTTGVERLALVPSSLHRRDDILNYVLSLDREAQILRTASLLSASSQTTVSFSTANLFALSLRKGGPRDKGSHRESGRSSSAADSPAIHLEQPEGVLKPTAPPQMADPSTASTVQTDNVTAAPVATSAAATPVAGDRPTPNGGPAVLQPMNAAVKEVVIDGEKKLVLIPDQATLRELQRRMQKTPQGSTTVASSADSTHSGSTSSTVQPSVRHVSLSRAILFAVVPKSLTCRSSFQHLISPQLSLTFRTDADSRNTSGGTTMTTSVEYHPDKVRTYASSFRMAVNGLKWCVWHTRVLNHLWTLKSKLTVLDRFALLQKLEISLTRRMSATAALENLLGLSLTEHGYLRTTLGNHSDDVSQGLITYMAFHSMSATAFWGKKVVWSRGASDPQHQPAHGQVQYTVTSYPLHGESNFGVEAFYVPSETQRYGLSFTATVPYAISPIAPPMFLVRSSRAVVVNQISFLYVRGAHRLTVPVIVFISPQVSHGLVWLAAPLTLYRIGVMLYRPYARARAIRYYTQQRKLHIAETDVAREKARLEQLALESLVQVSRASEDRKGGLVIINARYGVLEPQLVDVVTQTGTSSQKKLPYSSSARSKSTVSSASSGWWPSQIITRAAERLMQTWLHRRAVAKAAASGTADEAHEMKHDAVRGDAIPLTIDVTIALQNLVRDSALTLPLGSKSSLVGFCDPDPFTPEEKKLKVVYWFRRRKHWVVFDDDEAVDLPQREHLVEH